MIYRMAPFPMILNDSYPQFQGHVLFDAEYLINGTTYRHSFNEILIGTYKRPILNSVISNDLERLNKILNDTKHRAVSLRQLNFLFVNCVASNTHVWHAANFLF